MNLENKFDIHALSLKKSIIKRVFFFRICGSGMGSAACLLKEKGYDVEGADREFSPPMSNYLASTKIKCYNISEINKEYLQTFDLIVVGNVVGRNSPDAKFIENCNVPFASFPATLGALILKEQKVIGISGTHGKTTTTYLLTQIFKNLGYNPGYLIGGIINNNPPSRIGDGNYFFIESDEYDSAYFEKISKFRMYCLDHLILTSLEFDHGDIFPDLEAIKDQFRALIPEVTSDFIFNDSYPAIIDLYNEFKDNEAHKYFFYSEQSEIGPRIVSAYSTGTVFKMTFENKPQIFQTNLVGLQNILNLSACIIFAYNEGIAPDKIREAVKNLELVQRRQDIRGFYKKSLVIDDFAHHPRSVSMTINSIKTRYPGKKLCSVLCAASATARSSVFQEEFTNSLLESDLVIVVRPERPTSIKTANDLDTEKMVAAIKTKSIPAYHAENLKELQSLIDKISQEETILLIMSNSTCHGLWESEFVDQITEKEND